MLPAGSALAQASTWRTRSTPFDVSRQSVQASASSSTRSMARWSAYSAIGGRPRYGSLVYSMSAG